MKHKTAVSEIRRMTPQELRKDLQVKRAEAAKMRLGLEMQSEKNSGLYRAHKRDIARMTMVLHEMQKNPVAAKSEVKIAPRWKTNRKPCHCHHPPRRTTGRLRTHGPWNEGPL